MRKIFLILSLFIFSCSEDEKGTIISNSDEIDADWFLIKTPNYNELITYDDDGPVLSGNGYIFYYTAYSNITNLNMYELDVDGPDYTVFDSDSGILSFTYDNQNFTFDLTDAYDSNLDKYRIHTSEINGGDEGLSQRIVYNQSADYFIIFGPDGQYGFSMNCSNPNELIDYR